MTAAITLRPFVEPTQRVAYVSGGISLQIASAGARCTLYRDHAPKAGRSSWHPAHWWGTEDREDQHGHEWTRVLPRQVQDDYGYLVEVPQ